MSDLDAKAVAMAVHETDTNGGSIEIYLPMEGRPLLFQDSTRGPRIFAPGRYRIIVHVLKLETP